MSEFRAKAAKAAKMVKDGLQRGEIAKELGVSRQQVNMYMRAAGVSSISPATRRFTVEMLQAAIDKGHTDRRAAAKHMGCSLGTIKNLINEGGKEIRDQMDDGRSQRARVRLGRIARLWFLEFQSYSEIAEVLGMTVENVKRHLVSSGLVQSKSDVVQERLRVARCLLAKTDLTMTEAAGCINMDKGQLSRLLRKKEGR